MYYNIQSFTVRSNFMYYNIQSFTVRSNFMYSYKYSLYLFYTCDTGGIS